MKLVKPGMRTIKTGISVMLCIIIGNLNIIDNLYFSIVACILCMQSTVKSSLTVGLNRIKGTLIGGIMGFLFVTIKPSNPILAGLGTISTIYICNLLNIKKSISIACLVFCGIYINMGAENILEYSINRIYDTFIGIFIGVCVNYFIFRPNYSKRIYNEINIIQKQAIELLKIGIEHNENLNISSINEQITTLESLYKNLLDEVEYSIKDIDNQNISEAIQKCKQIHLHLQILASMNSKCYLDEETYIKTADIYEKLDDNIEIKNNISPVYNYHIRMVIENIKDIQLIKSFNN